MREYIAGCENNKVTIKGEIVRCADCRYVDLLSCPLVDNAFQQDEDFCSLGERKEEKQVTGKLESAENATSEGDESTTGQPKSKLYIPLNQHTVERINRLYKNDCGDYFDEEWLYNELEQIAEKLPEKSEVVDTYIAGVVWGYDRGVKDCERGLQLSPKTFKTSTKNSKTSTNKVDTPTNTPTDLISRQAVIEAFDGVKVNEDDCTEYDIGYNDGIDFAVSKLSVLPSALPPVDPERPKGEWVSCSEPPKDRRNVFIAHGTNDFKSCCIGHYEQGMGWYEDRNFFAKPIYDCKYWCDIPELPNLGDNQFGTGVSADMRGDSE